MHPLATKRFPCWLDLCGSQLSLCYFELTRNVSRLSKSMIHMHASKGNMCLSLQMLKKLKGRGRLLGKSV